MRKEPAFDRIVFTSVARQVSDSDRDTNRIAQLLYVKFEQIAVRGVASSAVAQQQDAGGTRVALIANAIPVPTQAIGGNAAELAPAAATQLPLRVKIGSFAQLATQKLLSRSAMIRFLLNR